MPRISGVQLCRLRKPEPATEGGRNRVATPPPAALQIARAI